MNKSITFYLVLLTFIVFSYVGHSTNSEATETFESERNIAIGAHEIATKRLVKNKKDPIALKLVDLANHLSPNYEPLLLLRARMKYNLKIPIPESEIVSESDFVKMLKEKTEDLSKRSSVRNRHLNMIYYQIIRLFEPDYERALIELMKFENQGESLDLKKLLQKKYSQMPFDELDPKDPRYAIGEVTKTIRVPADQEWTDSWIKVEKGKVITIKAKRMWSLVSFDEDFLPYTDADGYEDATLQYMLDKARKDSVGTRKRPGRKIPSFINKNKYMNPGCLLVKVDETVYPAGKNVTIRPKNSGILYLGPFEWDTYSDNSGYLEVKITVSDK
jgi:hypothetical protein